MNPRWENTLRRSFRKSLATVVALVQFLGMGVFQSLPSLPDFLQVLPAHAAIPTTLGYQGRLKNSSGAPLTGTYSFTFRLYASSTGGSVMFTETQPTVSVGEGFFSVLLGSVTPFPAGFDFNQPLFLTTEVNGDGEMTPRITINSVPYAYTAGGIDSHDVAPVSATGGRMYYNTTNASLSYYDGLASMWVVLGSSGSSTSFQAVTNAGAITTNPIQFGGGTSTGPLSLQNITFTNGTGTNTTSTNLYATNLGFNGATGTNLLATGSVSTTNLFANVGTFATATVMGQAICLSNGVGCPAFTSSETDTLQSVTNRGAFTTTTLSLFGGANVSTLSVTSTLTLSGTVSSNLIPTTDLAFALGDATHRWNGYFGNTTTTNATTTNLYATNGAVSNLTFTNATGVFITATTGTFTNLVVNGTTPSSFTNLTWTNATGTNTTSTNLFATNLFYTSATGTTLNSNTINGGVVNGGTLTVTGTSTLGNTTATNLFANVATFATGTIMGQAICLQNGVGCPASNVIEVDTLQSVTNRGAFTTTTLSLFGGANVSTLSVTSTLTVSGTVSSNLIPTTDLAFSLGSATNRWNGYFGNTTTTNATTTNSFVTNGSITNLTFTNATGVFITATTGTFTNLVVNGTTPSTFTNLVWTNATGTNTTSTNLYATSLGFVNATGSYLLMTTVSTTNLLVGGSAVCLANGTNCPSGTSPNFQTVTNSGNTTTNALQFAGGTSTNNFLPSTDATLNLGSAAFRWNGYFGNTTTTNATTTFLTATTATITNLVVNGTSPSSFANLTWTNATGTNTTSTNLFGTNLGFIGATGTTLQTTVYVSSTNIIGNIGTFATATVAGQNICLSNGVGCPTFVSAETDTLQSVTNRGAFTTTTLSLFGGANVSTLSVTSTLTVSGTVSSNLIPTTDLAFSLGSATNRWNGYFGNTTTTNATTTNSFTTNGTISNLTFTNATGVFITATTGTFTNLVVNGTTPSTFTNLVWTNATGTNTTSTNLYATSLGFVNATGSYLLMTTVSTTNLLVGGSAVCLANGTNCPSGTSPNFQTVTNSGNTTTNALQFAGGTSTNNFLPSTDATLSLGDATHRWNGYFGNTTTTNATTTFLTATTATITNLVVNGTSPSTFANLTWTNATGTNTTSTNLFGTNLGFTGATGTTLQTTVYVSSTNIIGNIGTFATATVAGQNICLSNGVGCPPTTETDTLQSVTNRGAFTTTTLSLFGGANVSTLSVTSTLTVSGTVSSNLIPTTDLAFSLGSATNRWNGYFGNTTTTNATTTNLYATNGTIVNLTSTTATISNLTVNGTAPSTFTNLIWTNATGTNTTSTNLFGSTFGFGTATGTTLNTNGLTFGTGVGGSLNLSSSLTLNGVNVCLQDNTNCPSISGSSSDGSWVYNSTTQQLYQVTSSLDVLIGGTSVAGSPFVFLNNSTNSRLVVSGGISPADVTIGANTSSGLNSAFQLTGGNLFVSGNIGSVSSVYTNGSFIAGGTVYGDGFINKTNGNLILAASGGFITPPVDLSVSLGSASLRFNGYFGNTTTTNATTTFLTATTATITNLVVNGTSPSSFTNLTWTNATGTNTTSTNLFGTNLGFVGATGVTVLATGSVSTTNLFANIGTFATATVAGQNICLSNGVGCPTFVTTETDTLQSVTNRGAFTTTTLSLFGGANVSTLTVTSTLTVSGTVSSNLIPTTDLAFSLGNATNRWNGYFGNTTTTNATTTNSFTTNGTISNLTFTNATGVFITATTGTFTNLVVNGTTPSTFTNLVWTNATGTNTTSTNLFATNLFYATASGTTLTSNTVNAGALNGGTLTVTGTSTFANATATNLFANIGTFATATVAGQNICLSNGVGCPTFVTTETDTLQSVTNRGAFTTTTLSLFGGANVSTLTVTSTLNVSGTVSSNLIPTTDLAFSLGNATNRWNGYFGNTTSTNSTSTNLASTGLLTFATATGTTLNTNILNAATGTVTSLNSLNLFATNATHTSLFVTNFLFTNASGSTITATTGTFTNLVVNGTTPSTFTNLIWTNATGTNTTSTNLFATNLFFTGATGTSIGITGTGSFGTATATNIIGNIGTFATATVAGQGICLSNGVGCPTSTETDTLLTVSNRGAIATSTLTLFGGFVAASSSVTGTMRVAGNLTVTASSSLSAITFIGATGTNLFLGGNVFSNLLPSTDLAFSLGDATHRWNGYFGNTTTTNATTTFLTATTATITNLVVNGTTPSTFTNIIWTNATGTNTTSTNLFANYFQFNGATGTTLNATAHVTTTQLFANNATVSNITAGNVTATGGFWPMGRIYADFIPVTDLAFSLGSPTLRWNGNFGNTTTTNATTTNLFATNSNLTNLQFTNATGTFLTATTATITNLVVNGTSPSSFTNLIWTNATGTNTTSTNLFSTYFSFNGATGTTLQTSVYVSSTNIFGNIGTFATATVAGQGICLSNGVGCPTTASTETLLTVSNRGAIATSTLTLFGGFVAASSSVTGTMRIAGNLTVTASSSLAGVTFTGATGTNLFLGGNVFSNLLPSTDLAFSLGDATHRWNGYFGNTTTTNATTTFLTATTATITNLVVNGTTPSTFTNLIWTNATGTNTTSTNLFANYFQFNGATGTTLQTSLYVSSTNIFGNIGTFATATVAGQGICLSNGVGCPTTASTETLLTVSNRGAIATSTLTLFGGFVAASSSVTGTLNVTGNLTYVGATGTNLTATGLLTFGTATGTSLFVSGRSVLDGTTMANATATNVTSTGLFGTYLGFTGATGTSLQTSLYVSSTNIFGNIGTFATATVAGQGICLSNGSFCPTATSNDTLLIVTNRGAIATSTLTLFGGFVAASSSVTGTLRVTGNLIVTSSSSLDGTTFSSATGANLFISNRVFSNLVPSTDIAFSLGSSTSRWNATLGSVTATSLTLTDNLILSTSTGRAIFGTSAFPNRQSSTDAFGLTTYNTSTPGSMKSGLVTEVSGALLSFAINAAQLGDRVTSTVGAIFRLDTRAGSPYWSLKRQPAGVVQTEVSDFQISTDGFFGFGAAHQSDLNTFGGLIHMYNTSGTKPVEVVQAAQGQTANMTEWWTSSGTRLLAVTASGSLSFLTPTGTINMVSTGTLSIVAGTSTLLALKSLGTNFGAAVNAGAFIDRNSFIGDEFNTQRTTISADTSGAAAAGFGDGGGWGVYENGTCDVSSLADTANGIMRLSKTTAGADACAVILDEALNNSRLILDADNLPVMLMKIRPGGTAAGDNVYAGMSDATDAVTTAPTNFIGFGNNGAGTWLGITRSAGTETAVTCTGQTISTTNFALLMVEVRSSTEVRFFVDPDVTNGISFSECGNGSTTNIPTGAMAPEIHWSDLAGTSVDDALDVDFYRAWQDDGPVEGGSSTTTPNFYTQSTLAQYYPADDVDLAPGTVVSIDTSATSVKAMPTMTAYDPNFLGVVVNDPGLILSNGTFDGIRVASQGRVRVIASTENGAIATGDVLTTASTTGALMKATGPGFTVGRALESLSGTSTGLLVVQLSPSYYTPTNNGVYNVVRAIGYLAVGDVAIPPVGPTAIAQFTGTTNTYLQVNLQNFSTGTQASSDYVATANNGDDTHNYIDMGINSSNYNNSSFTINGPNDGYLYVNGGDLTVGTADIGDVIFHTGGTLSSNERMRITSAGWVGIGTAAPTAMLDVGGNAKIAGTLQVGGQNVCLANGTNCPSTMSSLTVTSTLTVLGNTTLAHLAATDLDISGTINTSDILVGGLHVCLEDGTNCSLATTYAASSTDRIGIGTDTEALSLTVNPQFETNAVWITADVHLKNTDSVATSDVILRVKRGKDCVAGDQVGSDRLVTLAESSSESMAISVLDVPNSSSDVDYYLCLSSSGGAAEMNDRAMNAQVVKPGVDLAEVYYSDDASLTPGDVVSLDPTAEDRIRRSTGAYDGQVLGVISTRPGSLLMERPSAGGKPQIVALAGRIPVKVTTSNGVIAPGDYLTASAIPGIAMKATRAGMVIGQALTGYDGDDVGSVMLFAKHSFWSETSLANAANFDALNALNGSLTIQLGSTGSLMVIGSAATSTFEGSLSVAGTISAAHIDAPEIAAFASSVGSIAEMFTAASGSLQILSGHVDAMDARLTLAETSLADIATRLPTSTTPSLGMLTVPGLQVDGMATIAGGLRINDLSAIGDLITIHSDIQFIGRPYVNADTAGFAMVHKGDRRVRIVFDDEYLAAPVVNATISFEDATTTGESAAAQEARIQSILDSGIQFAIVHTSTTGFEILLNKPATEDTRLSWTAWAVKNAKVFLSVGEAAPPVTPPTEEVTPPAEETTPPTEEVVPPTEEVTPPAETPAPEVTPAPPSEPEPAPAPETPPAPVE